MVCDSDLLEAADGFARQRIDVAAVSTLGDALCLPTANRSMVGVLNEYVRLAGYAHDDLDSTPDLVCLSDWLAQTPMGPLRKGHGSADRELAALIAAV